MNSADANFSGVGDEKAPIKKTNRGILKGGGTKTGNNGDGILGTLWLN